MSTEVIINGIVVGVVLLVMAFVGKTIWNWIMKKLEKRNRKRVLKMHNELLLKWAKDPNNPFRDRN